MVTNKDQDSKKDGQSLWVFEMLKDNFIALLYLLIGGCFVG